MITEIVFVKLLLTLKPREMPWCKFHVDHISLQHHPNLSSIVLSRYLDQNDQALMILYHFSYFVLWELGRQNLQSNTAKHKNDIYTCPVNCFDVFLHPFKLINVREAPHISHYYQYRYFPGMGRSLSQISDTWCVLKSLDNLEGNI